MDVRRIFNEVILNLAVYLKDPIGSPVAGSWYNMQNALAYLISSPPKTLQGMLQMFHRPIQDWWPHPAECPMETSSKLLMGGDLSEDARIHLLDLLEQIKDPKNVAGFWGRIALENQQFREVFDELRTAYRNGETRALEEYVLLRKFLIEHPYATDQQIRTAFMRTIHLSPSKVGRFYRDLSGHQNEFWTCHKCGPLEPERGHLLGIKPSLCDDHDPEHAHVERIHWTFGLRQVTLGVHHRVVQPGKSELRLLDHARAFMDHRRSLLEATELWPEFDRFDLKLQFKDGRTWLIDVKDQKHAHRLGQEVAGSHPALYPREDLFYVIPQHRLDDSGHYLRVLGGQCATHPRVHLISEHDFLKQLHQQLRPIKRSRKANNGEV